MILRTYHKIRDAMAILLMASLIYTSILLDRSIYNVNQQLNQLAPKLQSTASALEKVSNTEAAILTDPANIKQINNLLNKFQSTVSHIDSTTQQIDLVLLPHINKTIDDLHEPITNLNLMIQASTITIEDTHQAILKLSQSAVADLDDIHKLLSDERLSALLNKTLAISDNVLITSENIKITSKDLEEALKDMKIQLHSIAQNINTFTEQGAIYLTGINKPLTKKQKIIRLLLTTLLQGGVAYARH